MRRRGTNYENNNNEKSSKKAKREKIISSKFSIIKYSIAAFILFISLAISLYFFFSYLRKPLIVKKSELPLASIPNVNNEVI